MTDLKIEIDEEALRKRLRPDHFESALGKHKRDCRILGDFIIADRVEYKYYPKSEVYLITKGDITLKLSVDSTPIDGAWMTVELE